MKKKRYYNNIFIIFIIFVCIIGVLILLQFNRLLNFLSSSSSPTTSYYYHGDYYNDNNNAKTKNIINDSTGNNNNNNEKQLKQKQPQQRQEEKEEESLTTLTTTDTTTSIHQWQQEQQIDDEVTTTLPITATEKQQQQPKQQQQQIQRPKDEDIPSTNTNTNNTMIAQRQHNDDIDSSNNMNDGRKAVLVTTIQGRQGFHLPLDLLEWNLRLPPSSPPAEQSSSSTPSSRRRNNNFTKTICTTRGFGVTPAETIKDMFNNTNNWEFIPKSTDTDDDPDCTNSRIRILWEGFKSTKRSEILHKYRQSILQHVVGEQLTTNILGSRINKESLYLSIFQNENQNQTTTNNKTLLSSKSIDLLKNSIPTTRNFNSTTSCKNFCDNEWLISQQQQPSSKPQQWIWKPKNKMKGIGIVLIGEKTMNTNTNTANNNDEDTSSSSSSSPLELCHQHCTNEGGETLQAQIVVDAMLLPDKRKIDIRSHILVANVDPLIVFTGAEVIRICVEPMNATNPAKPYHPGLLLPAANNNNTKTNTNSNSSWNLFQQVCNVGRDHPTPGMWSYENNIGPLEKGITDEMVRSKVITKIEQHNYALVGLLHRHWVGKIGMFQVLAADYLVEENLENNNNNNNNSSDGGGEREQKIWLLELNDNPGFPGAKFLGTKTYPNPWGDVFEIEWTILQTYNQYCRNHHHHLAAPDGCINNNNSDDDRAWKRILQQRLSTLELETLRMMPPLVDVSGG